MGRAAARFLASGGLTAAQDVAGPDGQPLRLLVRAITLPGADAPLLYAVAGDRREIQLDRQGFDRLLSLALGILFVGVIGAVLVQVRFGLEPLRRLGRALGAIRGGATARLEGDFPAEIEPLAAELNALLEHNEALVERARTHVGNLAHGLKTPLSVLTNEARRSEGPLAELVGRQVALMRRQVDHHLARPGDRHRLDPRRADRCPAGTARPRAHAGPHLRRQGAGDRDRLSARAGVPRRAPGSGRDAGQPSGQRLQVGGRQRDGRAEAAAEQVLQIAIEDDGPGLPAARRAEVLERGRRLDEQVPGTGLGLAIAADLAQLYGGRLVLEAAPAGGLRALLILPAADPGHSPRILAISGPCRFPAPRSGAGAGMQNAGRPSHKPHMNV